MASSSKKRTTMAKLNRERALIEKRQEKAARKAARKLAAASPTAPSEAPAAESPPLDGLRSTAV
jgi:uncharacterized protein HemY